MCKGITLFVVSLLGMLISGCTPGQLFGPTLAPSPTLTYIPRATLAAEYSTPSPFGIGSTWIRPADGMVMVYVPAGEFTMGNDRGDPDEQPFHTVTLDGYWIDQTEVTNTFFEKFMSETNYAMGADKQGISFDGSNWSMMDGVNWDHPNGPGSGIEGKGNYPVIHVSWNDAAAYCAWADSRLPGEAEWEKAARGNKVYTYPWGNTAPDSLLANYLQNVGGSSEVGNYLAGASPYGALDMAGNVWEWVNDWYDGTYYIQSPVANPPGPASGTYRIQRGGSWYSEEDGLRTAARFSSKPEDTDIGVGFRCARGISQ